MGGKLLRKLRRRRPSDVCMYSCLIESIVRIFTVVVLCEGPSVLIEAQTLLTGDRACTYISLLKVSCIAVLET